MWQLAMPPRALTRLVVATASCSNASWPVAVATPIVARARTTDSKRKLVLAGATRAVNPQRIGGRRLAAFALQPEVASFLDAIVHDDTLDSRVEQVTVGAGSALAGRTITEARVAERTGALLLAVRRGATGPIEPNPPGGATVPAGSVVIALGTHDQLDQLRLLAADHAS